MQIITTHINADFDCVASMVAASKLFPDATILLSGSMEKNVRDFLQEQNYPLKYRRLKGFDLDLVTEVIVVDASQKERLGPLKVLAEKEDVIFHVYDHHKTLDIRCKSSCIKTRGSTATIMVELLQERGISLNKEEATLLALGIYEDTGSLLFQSVCKEDYIAASILFEYGADLNLVNEYVNKELTKSQVKVLNELLENVEIREVNHIRIAISTANGADQLVEVASLATKIVEIENVDVVFILVRIKDHIQLVARSKNVLADVGLIAAKLGGGGHPSAASASLKKEPGDYDAAQMSFHLCNLPEWKYIFNTVKIQFIYAGS
ncbi:MAG: DHH family phosphoesterase [Nitrospinota bacterium]